MVLKSSEKGNGRMPAERNSVYAESAAIRRAIQLSSIQIGDRMDIG